MADSLAEMFGWKKVPKIYKRLENLVKYFIACEIGDSRLSIIENTKVGSDRVIHFKFYSKQGPVEIVLAKEFIMDLTYVMEYTTYSGVRLFDVKTTDWKVEVEPCMGYSYNVDAKDIDLAILELEQYLQDNYGNIDDRWEQYQLEEKLAWESHNEQLKELW